LLLVLPLPSLLSNFSSLDLSADTEAQEYGLTVMEALEPEALLITQTDAHTFTLNYFRYAEEKRVDLALLDGHLLYHDWYRRHLPWIHPHIDLPPQAFRLEDGDTECVSSLLVSAIDLNWQRYPTYLTDPDDEIRACYTLAKAGSVYRVIGYREG
jgi:hypothetical protein